MGVPEPEKVEEKAAEEKPAAVATAEEEAAEQEVGGAKPEVPAGYVPVRALQDERLKRQEAERRLAEVKPQAEPAAKPQPREYTEDELDALEEDARARGDRATSRAVQNYRMDRRARAIVEERDRQAQRVYLHTQVTQGLMQSFPALGDPNSDLFRSAATEFTALSGEYIAKGLDIASDPHATELAVGRALRKNPELTKKYSGGVMPKPKAAEAADTHVETGEGGSPPKAAEKGSKLTQRELDFARRTKMDPKEYAKWKDRDHRG